MVSHWGQSYAQFYTIYKTKTRGLKIQATQGRLQPEKRHIFAARESQEIHLATRESSRFRRQLEHSLSPPLNPICLQSAMQCMGLNEVGT